MKFPLLLALLAVALPMPVQAEQSKSNDAVDLNQSRRCAWSDGSSGRWVEAGQCRIEGWQGAGELLLTVQWPSGQRSVIETKPGGGAAQVNRRPASFQSSSDGTWIFRLSRGGAMRFSAS
ncbi:MAG: hypothetical protein CBD29_03315 [Synechococcus sp. TMED169]|jgi:hypothetical protein|nr:MAG: hypothetical protein CBD29_03315 [Synechococcus sp. TMED169]|tara:strand:- start:364 stop:723 length:360 start_codon:yes stop_codon:yes gene_type:complete